MSGFSTNVHESSRSTLLHYKKPKLELALHKNVVFLNSCYFRAGHLYNEYNYASGQHLSQIKQRKENIKSEIIRIRMIGPLLSLPDST